MFTYIGSIELNITKNQAIAGYHSGQCYESIKQLSMVPAIKKQLKKLDVDMVKNELSEYVACDDSELNNHDDNLQRLLWLACGNIYDEIYN